VSDAAVKPDSVTINTNHCRPAAMLLHTTAVLSSAERLTMLLKGLLGLATAPFMQQGSNNSGRWH